MAKLTRQDKHDVARWVSAHPRKAARIERGVMKFIAKIARKQRKRRALRYRRTR